MIETADRMLADIRKLASGITSRAAEIEAARRMPPDLVDTLRSIGIFRMFAPRSHGGLELDLPAGIEVIAELGKIEGSLGWAAMIASGSTMFISDRKSTRLNSSHQIISYAVFCLKKKQNL